jgi:Kef-type K+ transport system membrane component KefB
VGLSEADLARFLLSLGLLFLSAVAVGDLFERWRQPRVIGEIFGGVLLGPSLLGAVAPGLSDQILPQTGAAAVAVDVIYQLGLIWLMFSAGTQVRRLPVGQERVTTIAVTATGTILPFGLGLTFFLLVQPQGLVGPAGDETALALLFAAALAVTSIPVISRILLDLGLMRTSFARVVIGAAVVEDLLMFAVLGVAIGIVQLPAQEVGLTVVLGIASGSPLSAIYYVGVTGAALAVGSAIAWWASGPGSLPARAFADQRLALLFLLAMVTVCLFANVPPLFGGLVAGLAMGGSSDSDAVRQVRSYGTSFFVPVYFAVIGSQLDLLSGFSPAGFLLFFVAACGVKAGSVFLGARLAGEPSRRARDISIAMNARGGPGIVLASVGLDAGIINGTFYASLVMLAILSSLLAGWWLERTLVPRDRLRRSRSSATEVEPRTATGGSG